MSNTRHSKAGTPPREQGFCSSVEIDRGLLGNTVALRCSILAEAVDREFFFALQYLSWQPGGLDKVASDLIARFPDHICTPTMRKIGAKESQTYTAEQTKAVRSEIVNGDALFPLQGEVTGKLWQVDGGDCAWMYSEDVAAKIKAQAHPKRYTAQPFLAACREAAQTLLPEYLKRICVDPGIKMEDICPWWFSDLLDCLRNYLKSKAAGGGILAETEVSRQVFEGLDYCLHSGEMTPIEGLARIGKTHAAKVWCERNPGRARYVQVPPTNDDASFIRRVAEAYGVGCGLSMKSTQIRERVERTARASKMILVLDEAHSLLTQDYRARKRPSRISWVVNELVNYGVPVALLTTPQFEVDKERIKQRTGWNWDQFDGRIGVPIVLPRELSMEELAGVARAHLPQADEKAIKALVGYALFSKSLLAGIEHVVKRALFEAERAGRNVTNEDVQSAIKRRLPVDSEASKAASALASGRAVESPLATVSRNNRHGKSVATGPRLSVLEPT